MSCYNKAKNKVKSGKVTWEELEKAGLSKEPGYRRLDDHPFERAFKKKMKRV